MSEEIKIITSGKRKRAVARAILTRGTGKISINKRDYKQLQFFDKLKIEEVIKLVEHYSQKIDFDVKILVHGGGEKGQIDAARVALAKAITKFKDSKELTKMFIDYDRNLLVADVRRKETYKPGDSKARSKRQTSYR